MKKFELNNNNEFKVPENYYKELENSILNETKRFNETSGYEVPSNYFVDLEATILQSAVNKKQGKNRKLWISVSSVAACLLVIVSVYLHFSSTITFGEKSYVLESQNTPEVDAELEHDVYESLYKSYFVEEEKKSPNDIALDDLDYLYLEQQFSSNN